MDVTRRKFLTYAGVGVAGLAATGTAVKLVADQLSTDPARSAADPAEPPPQVGPTNSNCLWGAYVDPGSGTAIAAIQDFEQLIGRKLDLTRHYIRWDRSLVNDPIVQSAKQGRTPFIAWHTQRLDGTWVRWADIAAGMHDRELQAQARILADWGGEAYFVFNHEPENDPAGQAQDFARAFDHVRSMFENNGADRLRWVATLMRGTFQGASGGSDPWIPETCDLLGADGYNRGACNPSIGWESFSSIFDAAQKVARASGKGLVIEEWGCVESDACVGSEPGSKAEWLREAGATIRSWPEVHAVIYSHVHARYGGERVDFRVTSSRSALKAYREIGAQAYFSGGDDGI
jgi:hypothetical protein